MFLKRVKSWSLVSRLMMLYALSTAGILLSIGLYLYPMFSLLMQHIHDDRSAYLSAECFQKFIIAVLLSTIASLIFGYFIAKNGLSSVQNFSDKMEKMTADSLEIKINPEDFPKELQKLGNQFNQMLDRLHISFKQLSQFSSDIAHELRNPLHVLMGTTELALTRSKSPEEYQQILASHQEEYAHLSRLIENLLFLAKADHGKVILEKENLNAKNEIENICDYYQAVTDEKNIQLSVAGDAIITVDPTLFKRVFNNILSNAVKYTPENGTVNIKIKSDIAHTQISITDTGIGIDAQHLPNLFDRFYRVDPSRSTESGGLGLGLAIVKSIVALHSGEITIKSELNQGTSVILSIPSV